MTDKNYKNHEQMLDILRGRGMLIEDEAECLRILERENYYNVINGYKRLFIDSSSAPEEKYKPGTTFRELYALYKFDREIRLIFLKYLLKVENAFKSVLSNVFSCQYGHDNYLRLDNFFTGASDNKRILEQIAKNNRLKTENDFEKIRMLSTQQNTREVVKLIGDIQQEIARQMSKNHPAVTHYMSKYGYIPLWVLVNVLTLGKITTFYKLMKPSDKTVVAKTFGVQPDELHKYMSMCVLARNKCAHDERFFDISFKQSLHTKSIFNFKCLNIPRGADFSFLSGTNDAFCVAIIFAVLLGSPDSDEFVSAMQLAFEKLSSQLHTVSVGDVMEVMGFNCAWTNLPHLSRPK